MSDRVAALILAGGAARRLGGGDKPLFEVGGQPMLMRIVAALSDAAAIGISANGDPERFASFGLPILSDGPFVGQGPLAGVLAGLDWAHRLGATALLTVPGDTPFVPAGLAVRLTPPPAFVECGQPHYLVALWPVAVRDTLRRLLSAAGPRDVARFARAIGMRPVVVTDLPCDRFLNVNTLDDLAAARARAVAEQW